MRFLQTRAASRLHVLGVALCAGSLALFPGIPLLAAEPDQASDMAPPDTAASGASTALQEVTVTAERVRENLQRVPIPVNTLTGAQALARGATSIQSLTNTVPNLSFVEGSNATNLYLRGVGDDSSSVNNEPSVSVYVDGVYNAQPESLTSFQFNNIQRIEVLEGPQGTLFGRNSTAGVIQIITPDPSRELSGKLEAGYGNYDTYNADGYVTGGITDKLSADLAVLGTKQIDGVGRDWYTTAGVNGPSSPTFTMRAAAVRSKWLYNLSSATQIRFVADYADEDSLNFPPLTLLPQSAGLGPTTTPAAKYQFSPYPGPYNTFQGFPELGDNIQGGGALTVDHDIGSSMHFQSISSYRFAAGDVWADGVLVPELTSNVVNHFDGHYVTQEFHLTNQNPGRITWLVGAYYYGNQFFADDPRIQSTGPGVSGAYTITHGVQDTASGSVFGQTTAGLTDKTKLTLGVRYTDELLKAWNSAQNRAGTYTKGPLYLTQRDDPLTWRAALDHQFNSDIMGYISWNRGFKTGGFNLNSAGTPPYYGEHLDAYDIGMKSEFLNERIRFNLDGFYYHYTDMQVTILQGGGVTLFTNAAASRIYGLDENLDFVLTEHLVVSTGIGLLNARYLSWPNAPGYNPAGTEFIIPNAAGATLPYAPASSGFVSVNYHDMVTPVGTFHGTMTLSYKDRQFLTPDMGMSEPAYYMLDASVEWRALSDKSFAVRLWGRNLTNALWAMWGTEGTQGWALGYGMPRTYWITVEKDF
jgi:iron complex outermembrane recepter protein